jgi:hypothetical protein
MAAYHFRLKNKNTDEEYADMYFNGKFLFVLDDNIDLEFWNRIGLILVDDSRKKESSDLFSYVNSRLPIELRNADKEAKLEHIKKYGLEVASDSFVFKFIDMVEKPL